MRNKLLLLLAAAFGISTMACGCTKANEGEPMPAPEPAKPAAERFEVFPLLDPNSIPYRIPALAVTNDGTLVAISDFRHSGTDIGVTN